MKNGKWRFLFFSYLICFQQLYGEIEQIQISWKAYKCQFECLDQINNNFKAIKGVQDLKVNGSLGIGEMKWDPQFRLSYEPFRYAAAAVGINIANMRVRVKGKINHDSENVYLVSDRDETRFKLIGPINIKSGLYTPKYNLVTHPLPTQTKTQLIEAERLGKSTIISGPLFLPSYYPLTLVTEQIQFKDSF